MSEQKIEGAGCFLLLSHLFNQDDRILIRPVETFDDGGKKKSVVDYQGIRYYTPSLLKANFRSLLERAAQKKTNLFFGVSPRFGGDKKQQFDLAWQCRIVRVLWADVDNCSVDEAKQRCKDAGLPSVSAIVNSGNGVHLYWFLEVPYLIDDVPDPPPVLTEWTDKRPTPYYVDDHSEKRYLRDPTTRKSILANRPALSDKAHFMQDIVAGIAASIGGDATQDLSRLLRLPDTRNRKNERNGREPVACTLVQIDTDSRYSINDFVEFADRSPVKAKREVANRVSLPAARKPSAKRLSTLQEHVVKCQTAEDRSAADFALCCFAIENGIECEFVWQEVATIGKFSERGREYFDSTWSHAADTIRVAIYEKASGETVYQDEELEEDKSVSIDNVAESICVDNFFARDRGGHLYYYDRGAYRSDGERRIKQLVKSTLKDWGQQEEWTITLASSVVEYIQVDCPVLWDIPPADFLNLENGLLRLSDRKLLPHHPQHLSAIQLPVAYDARATCPATDQFDTEVFPDDAIGFGHEVLGMTCYPSMPIQKAVLLLGAGGNGKSRKLAQFQAFLGASNVSAVTLQDIEANRFTSARLVGKLANICPDLPSDHLKSTSVFKRITGGDPLSAEYKFKDSFDFSPFCKLVFSANEPPRSDDSSEGFFDRWVVVKFEGKFRGTAQEIPEAELDARLSTPQELSGLLNHVLDALDRIRASGKLSEPESVKQASREFHATTDPFAVWLDRWTIDDINAVVPKSVLRAAYSSDCEQRGRTPPNEKAFANMMACHRPEVATAQRTLNERRHWCYLGIAMNYPPSEAQISQSEHRTAHPAQHTQDAPTCYSSHPRNISSQDKKNENSKNNKYGDPVHPVHHVQCEEHDYITQETPQGAKQVCKLCGKFFGYVRQEAEN